MKVAIVVGHNAHPDHRGAVAVSGAQEFDVNLILGYQIVKHLGALGRLFTHSRGNWRVLAPTITQINDYAPEVCVELHWNAAVNAKGLRLKRYWAASYGICWDGDYLGGAWADALGQACAKTLDTKYISRATRNKGYPMLRDVTAPSILLETHNGLDETSHATFLVAVAGGSLGRALAETLLLGVAK